MEATRDCTTLTDAITFLADMDVFDFSDAVRAGKVGLVGEVFGLKPRELTKMVREEQWRRFVSRTEEKNDGQEEQS